MLHLPSPDLAEAIDTCVKEDFGEESSFAKRLITGIAAEGYFERVFPALHEFDGCRLLNTTKFGCGFDFKIERPGNCPFEVVEVKGLRARDGTILMTYKEYRTAERLGNRYFLFVARNFAEQPFHSLYQSPLDCGLNLLRVERQVVTVSWNASILS